jgi:hypothetical protein
MIAEATALCNRIADHFKIERPIINYTGRRGQRAWCTYAREGQPCEIRFSFDVWMGVETAMIHEMAHAVSWKLLCERGHGPVFQRTLRSIAKLVYGDASKYRWDLDYKEVAASAGVTTNVKDRRMEAAIAGFVKMGKTREEAIKLLDF